jgi:hypothetical protein
MTRQTSQCNSVGVPKSMAQSGCGPVAMVRTQKSGIKYEKPIVVRCSAQDQLQRRCGAGEGLMLNGVGGGQKFGGLGAGPVGSCPIFLRKIPEIFFLGPQRRKAD